MKTRQNLGLAGAMLLAGTLSSYGLSITQQPADQSVSIGATVRNVVVASGVAPLRYQWRFQGDELAGATNNSLVLSNIQVSQAGGYNVSVSDSSGSVTSRVARIEVDPTFTKITTGPPVTDLGSSVFGSWADYDEDGYADLFVARLNNGRSALYHNNGDGTFTSITNAPFAQSAGPWITGGWGDLDNDGQPDLVTARQSQPAIVYFGNGDGTFSPLQIAAASPNNVAVMDYNQDGLLDVLLAGNLYWSTPMVSWLYRNNGDRTFTRMTSQEVGPIVDFAMGGGATCADYDDDGAVDVFCAHVSGPRLFHNDGTGRFAAVTNVVFPNAVGVGAWGDYDNDGRLDLCAAAWNAPTYVYRNVGDGTLERAAIGPNIQGYYTSASWADYNNDGFLDLFLADDNGGPNALYHNNGDGTFTRITTGSIVTDVPANAPGSLGALWFDYNNDGFLDLYTFNNNDYVNANTVNFLYRNNGNSNAWLTVKLVGTVSNRGAVGTKVRAQARYAGQLRWQRRDISAGDAVNGNQLDAHFGLGDATNVDVLRIEWPSGTLQELYQVATNQCLTRTEPCIEPRQPAVTVTSNLTLTAVATGNLEGLQWWCNDAALPNATNPTLELTDVQPAQAGDYRVTCTNTSGSFRTKPVTLTVWTRPAITTPPTDQLVWPGSNATFSVTAQSLTSLTYQWQLNGTNLPGATLTSLTLSNVTLADEGVYTVVVTDSVGTTVSDPATLFVLIKPVILQPPLSQSVVEGGNVTLSAAISGNPPPFLFQWRRGSTILTNLVQPERTCFFTLTNVQTSQGGLHRLCITNAASPSVTAVFTTFTVTVLPDADADGLPDAWETACHVSDPVADDDGDGLCNGAEYLCGTDPTNALSYLKVEGIRLDAGGEAARLEFFAASNKTYSVQYREELGVGDWQRLTDVLAVSSNRVVAVTDPTVGRSSMQRIYRLTTPRLP